MRALNLVKVFLIVIIAAIVAGMLSLWFQTVVMGNYITSAGMFMSIMTCLVPFVVLALAFYAVRFIVKFQPSDIDL